MTTVVVSQPMLFPWVGMFEQIALADIFVHYDDVQFSKGSFTNRVQLKNERGRSWMTVPLAGLHLGQLILDLRTDESVPWRDRHRDQVRSSLSGAPSIDDALHLLQEVYANDGPLTDLLIHGVERVSSTLTARTATTRFVRASELGVPGEGGQRVLDIVRDVGGSTYVTGHGAQHYLDAQHFEECGVEVRYMNYAKRAYPQLHGEFTPFVSVLDLIANTGSDSGRYLDPRTINWRAFATGT